MPDLALTGVPPAKWARREGCEVGRTGKAHTKVEGQTGSLPQVGEWWGFEVVVLPGALVGVDVGRWDEAWGAVLDGDGPLFFVDQVVVETAEQDAVVGGGFAAV